VSLIYTNAWILRGFPHVCTYVTIQQAVCFLLASFAVKICKIVETPPALSWKTYFLRVAPLGVCFTLYLWGSNTAYRYLEPGLIQMLKSIGSCFVFILACLLGVETFSKAKALNFFYISIGTILTAAPQLLDEARHSVHAQNQLSSSISDIFFGVFVLMGAYLCDAYYVVSIQRLSEGDLVTKCFGPLATLMYISPIVTFCLGIVSFFVERDAWSQLAQVGLPLFALACILAFAFNIAILNFIGRLSATSYVIFDYFKDITILSFAFFVFSEDFKRNELIGYAVVLAGATVWQHRKLTQPYHDSTSYKLLQQSGEVDGSLDHGYIGRRSTTPPAILLQDSRARSGVISPQNSSSAVRERATLSQDDEAGLMLVPLGDGGKNTNTDGVSYNPINNTMKLSNTPNQGSGTNVPSPLVANNKKKDYQEHFRQD